MNTGRILKKPVLDHLIHVACAMMKNERERARLSHDDCEGFVEAELETVCYVTMGGMVFNAHVETDAGTTNIRYFVRSNTMEHFKDLDWFTVLSGKIVPLEEAAARQAAPWN